MACRDVTNLQSSIHATVGMNCNRISNDLQRQYGEYQRRVIDEQSQLEERARLQRARTDKTAVLLSEAYVEKQKRLQREHKERRSRTIKFADMA